MSSLSEKQTVTIPPMVSRQTTSRTFNGADDVSADTKVPDSLPKVLESGVQPAEDEEEWYPEGGYGWIVVLGCFMQASITLGVPLAWGVLQEYFLAQNTFPGVDVSIISLLGASNGAVMPAASFIFGKLEDRYGYKPFIILGSCCSFLTWFCTAWSTKLWHFFLTQGLLMGLTNGILFPVVCAYPSQWFKRKRGLATGIVIAGSSIGGGTTALILRTMLSRLGLRRTFLIYTGVDVVVLIASYIMLKDRPRPGSSLVPPKKIEWIDSTRFREPVFWSLTIAMVVCAFGYQGPYFFISIYTGEKVPGLSHTLRTLPITVMNFSAALGRVLVGFTGDRLGPVNTFVAAIFISGLTQVAIWNFAYSYGTIMAFAVLYGFWGGCFVSLLTPVAAQLFGFEQLANLTGLLTLANLPGYISGPTLAGVVLDGSHHNWHAVALYSGGMQLLSAVILLYARFKTERRFLAIL